MKKTAFVENRYQEELSKYLINGEFVFPQSFDVDTDKSLLEIIGRIRLANYDAVLCMKILLSLLCVVFYQREDALLEKDYEIDVFKWIEEKKHNLSFDQTLAIMASCRNFAYSDLLEYELSDEEELNVIWRY